MARDAFLGITHSTSGARWIDAPKNLSGGDQDRLAAALIDMFDDLPLPLARIMAGMGLNCETAPIYIKPKIRDLMPNPSRFQDMDKAANRLADAVVAKMPIGVFGDYDVDGAAAAALLISVMRDLDVPCDVHIPDRFTEGYGPNTAALMALKEKGAQLLVTVDCGITAHAPLAAVADTGIDVIVIDHHIAGPELPRAHSVVNPNRLDEDGQYGYLCAAGVVFITLVSTLRCLRDRNYFTNGMTQPDLLSYLDIVALATVCDVVPLQGLNRAFVRQGLKVMAERRHVGLTKLADVAGMNSAPNVYALGFLLGPRINAAGRIGGSGLGVKLLACCDADEAAGLALRLDEMNQQRKHIEEGIKIAAIERAADQNDPVLILHDTDWHEGVIGIVAGRVRERFGKPALIIAMSEDGIGKGSGRSIAGFRLGSAIIGAYQSGILEGGGGHDMAAGFTVKAEKISDLKAFLNDRLMIDLNGVIPQVIHKASGLLSVAGCKPNLADWLDRLGPFGSGNPEPRFVIPDCRIKSMKFVGEGGAHLSCRINDGSGTINAIAFQAGGTPLGRAVSDARDGQYLHFLGRIRRDQFRGGNAMQFEIDDVAVPPLAFAR
ncbi:MAG: single-stranded-DNA-specific exonuclease RecJ [Candidatus Puniceispirillaceae bacterium]